MQPTAPLSYLGACAALALPAAAQIPVFSVDWRSPTIATPDSFTATPITEADVLAPAALVPGFGPLPTPGILESGGVLPPAGLGLALHGGCVGHPPGTPCRIEVDALSHGLDRLVQCSTGGVVGPGRQWAFGVSFRAMGIVGSPLPPAVWTEAPCQDEAADIFVDLGLPCGPLMPTATPPGNTGYLDGDGLASCAGSVYPGLGLIENPPGVIPGDNLDAFDDDVPDRFFPRTTCTYFSLDANFVDPLTGVPNSGSALAHGFAAADVLMTCPGCPPAVYAPAVMLGLDLFGPGTDDVDAIALHENGVPGYQRSTAPYDWVTGGRDMLFFSVRRGSAIVGMADSFFGMPIEPGDILVPTGAVGSPPGIWIPAESLGLATVRATGVNVGDDLDSLDTLHEPQPGQGYCFGDGTGTPCPCGNNGGAGRGCGNSVNALGGLLWGNGFPSIANDRLTLTCSGLPGSTNALLFQGTSPLAGTPFGDGLRCVAGSVVRIGVRQTLCGNREWGHNMPGDPKISFAGGVAVPGLRYYQVWYRNSAVFCTAAPYNLTNGYQVQWVP